MNVLKSPWFWVVAVLILAGLWFMGSYNNFITLDQKATTQWAQVETQYQRRVDLIPNLVESVKGIFDQEKDVFGALADARTKYGSAQGAEQKAQAANGVESALSRLLVVVENYPQLRSSENVSQLMDELAGTENRIATERRRYNDVVQEYNLAVKRFPGNIFAGIFGFKERTPFQAEQGAGQAPDVNFSE